MLRAHLIVAACVTAYVFCAGFTYQYQMTYDWVCILHTRDRLTATIFGALWPVYWVARGGQTLIGVETPKECG